MPDRTPSAGVRGAIWPDVVLSFLGVIAIFVAGYFLARSA